MNLDILYSKIYWAYLKGEFTELYGDRVICVPWRGYLDKIPFLFRVGRYVCVREPDVLPALHHIAIKAIVARYSYKY